MIVTVGIITKAAAAAVIGTLTFNSGRNILQTQQLISNTEKRQHTHCQQEPMDSIGQTHDTTRINQQQISTRLNDVMKFQRAQTLQVYLDHCYIPESLTYFDGEWNGVLLPNNGLTSVTEFLTNTLFGVRRKWNGKSFNIVTMEGVNRFNERQKQQNNPKNIQQQIQQQQYDDQTASFSETMNIEEEHKFLFNVEQSQMMQYQQQYDDMNSRNNNNNKKQSSIIIRYSKYQGIVSLWKSMVDEVRVLPTPNDDDMYDIVIGFGCMAWSGGILNSSPFCLYRLKQKYVKDVQPNAAFSVE